jgi:membrane-bound inhibitor of C-type lysozyme
MKKLPFFSLAVIILILLGVWWFANSQVASPKTNLSLISTVTYACDNNQTIKTEYFEGPQIPVAPGERPVPNGKVKLDLSDGRTLSLPQTISASGIRYANQDESIIFWSKGDGAFIIENEVETYSNCQAQKDILGGDRDEYGCIGSAGYVWCESKDKCLRTWEEECS